MPAGEDRTVSGIYISYGFWSHSYSSKDTQILYFDVTGEMNTGAWLLVMGSPGYI